MRVSAILGHPRPGSFNHAVAEAAVRALRDNGHDVRFHDLYAEGFDPILPPGEIPRNGFPDASVEEHCAELAEAEGIVIVHPNWWGQPPAVLKGWVDRVFRPGVAYEFAEGVGAEGILVGLLKARQALVFNTSNTPAELERKIYGDPLETLWKNCVFGACGVAGFLRKNYGMVVGSAREQRTRWLEDVRETVNRCFPAPA
jgi:putative NADPH-quinone reductase